MLQQTHKEWWAFSGKVRLGLRQMYSLVYWVSTAPLTFQCISCIIDTGKLHLTLTNRVAKLVDRDQNSPSWRFLPVRDPEGGGKAVPILSLSCRFLRQGFITTFRLVLNSQPSYLRVPRAGHCRLASSCWALLLYAQVFLALWGQQQWQSLICPL